MKNNLIFILVFIFALTGYSQCTPPVITANPPNRAICVGNNTSFSALASGATAFQWQVNTGSGFTNIINGAPYSGATTTSLSVTGATAMMSGYQYRMVAINGDLSCFTNTNAGTLTVPAPILNPQSQTNIACNGGNTGAATVNAASGGIPPYTYNWTPGNPTGDGTTTITGLTAGTWTCTVTDNLGCTASANFNVTQVADIVVTPNTQTNVSCFGGSNGAASINTPTGGLGGYSYNWTPGNPSGDGTVSVTGLNAGTWTCTVTDGLGCSKAQSFTITAPPAIVVTPNSQTNVSCFGGSNGAASINTPTGGSGGFTYNWTPGNPAGDGTTSVTGLSAGTWTCTVTDANSCTASQIFNVTQPSSPVSGSTVVSNVACFGGANGAINLTPNGGTGPYTFFWLPSGPTTEDRTGLFAGTYQVQITDANGCTGTVSATVTQPTAPVSGTTVVTSVSCFGGSNGTINLTPSGGTGPYTFFWLPSGPTTEDRTGLVSGTYQVQITDMNGCSATVSATVTQPTTPVSGTTVVTNVACNGGTNGTINLTPSGGTGPYMYNWGGGITTEDRISLVAGTYSVTITDANACTGAVSGITVTQPSAISFTAASQTNVACFGDATGAFEVNAALGGAGSFTYDWTPGTPTGDGTTSVTGLTAGSYSVTATDANACTATISFTITQAPALSVTPATQTNIACNGGATGAAAINTPTGGTPGYTYDWTPGTPTGDGTTSVTGLTAGTYTVTVTDANGCTANQSFTVTQAPALSVTPATQTNIACNGGATGAAAINTPTGGTPSYTYDWTPGTPTGDGTNSVTGLTAGTYTVTVTDANGCTANQSFTVTQPTVISFTAASQTNVACFGDATGAFEVNAALGGAGSFTYDWTPGTPTGDGTTSVTGLTVGSYSVTATDANACTATISFTITQAPALSVTPATQTNIACNGGATGAAAINTPTGGTPGYTYDWTPGTPTGDGTTSVTGLSAGTYTVTVTDANGCTTDQLFTISQPMAITHSFTAVDCDSYTWNTQTYDVSGTYTQVLASASGCDSTVTLDLTINMSNSETLNIAECESYTLNGETYTASGTYTQVLTNSAACDSIITLNLTINSAETNTTVATACDSYLWNGQSYTISGFYTLSFTNANGCDSTENLDLIIVSSPEAGITSIDATTLQATGTGTFQWITCDGTEITGETDANFTATSNGSYAVIVSQDACSDTSDCVVINQVGLNEKTNSFGVTLTPNPAENNVKLTFTGINEASIVIYDTQGKMVMSVNHAQSGELLSIEALERGVYLVNIITNSGYHTERLVKQ